jgi:ATP-dependent Clp protease ATP-binding subunit ClpA
MVIAEIALLKIAKLAEQYRLRVHFVAPELLLQALAANEKVSRFGIRELERILDEMLANQLLQAKDQGAHEVALEANEAGEVVVVPSG